jgi:inosine-uridine nucleoside N-ribohydrolase
VPISFPKKVIAENVVREVVIMGGTLILPGNVTPTGGGPPPDPKLKIKEFNISTDPEAASILFSLTSIHSKTHPDAPRLPRPLKLTILPLDATHLHGLTETLYQKASSAAVKAGSPLATFVHVILDRTYRKVQSLVSQGRESTVVELHMHDPLALYYAMLDDEARKEWVVEHNVDVRVECSGTWTRGMTLLDQRVRGQRPFEKTKEDVCSDEVGGGEDTTTGDYEDVDDDEGEWRGGAGNKLDVVWGSSSLEGGNLRTVEILADMIWSF